MLHTTSWIEYLQKPDLAVLSLQMQQAASRLGNRRAAQERMEAELRMAANWRLPLAALQTIPALNLARLDLLKSGDAPPQFPAEVRQRAERLLQLEQRAVRGSLPEDTRRVLRARKLRRLYYLAYTDRETALLALLSHLVQMDSLASLDRGAARLLCEDNRAIFLPLLELFGMWELRRKMGNLCLQQLNPGRLWDKINNQRTAAETRQAAYRREVAHKVADLLKYAGVSGEVKEHLSVNSSLYRRVQGGESLSQLLRKLKFDVLVDSVDACYRALGLLHNTWQPVHGRTPEGTTFRDLIASPKFNGYQALITNLHFDNPEPGGPPLMLEFRIFTRQMYQAAMQGILYLAYDQQPAQPLPHVWWDDLALRQWLLDYPPESDSPEVYVFSPAGKVYRGLPAGSTPIDYAYKVHSEVGNHCTRIWINGQAVAPDHVLRNGDLVQIEVDPDWPGPEEAWKQIVKTSTAKKAIAVALRRKQPPKGRQIIDNLLERELKAYQLEGKISPQDIESHLHSAARLFGYLSLDAMYLDIARPGAVEGKRPISANKIVAQLIFNKLANHIARADAKPLGAPPERVRFTQCNHKDCHERLKPGEPIVGRLDNPGKPTSRLVVYSTRCPSAPREAPIPLIWIGDRRAGEPVRVTVQAVDRLGLLRDILDEIYRLHPHGLYLLGVEASVDREHRALLQFTVNSPDIQTVHLLEDRLNEMKTNGRLDNVQVDPLSPLDKLLLSQPDELSNPYSPLAVDDPRVFKGRVAEIGAIVSALENTRGAVVIYGISRVGKTSLLRYLWRVVLPARSFTPALIDLQRLAQHSEHCFWQNVNREIYHALEASPLFSRRMARHLQRNDISPYEAFNLWRQQNAEELSKLRLVLLFDEINLLEDLWKDRHAAAAVIAQLKSLVEERSPLQCIFTMQEALYRRIQMHGAQLTLGSLLRLAAPVALDYFTPSDARKLIEEPMGGKLRFDEALIQRMLSLTACHPYYLQTLLLDLVSRAREQEKRHLDLSDLQVVLPNLLATGNHHFHQFLHENHGFRRDVMRALAQAAQQSTTWLELGEITQCLQAMGYSEVKRSGLIEALSTLVDIGAVGFQPDARSPRYAIRVPLFSQWFAQTYPGAPALAASPSPVRRKP